MQAAAVRDRPEVAESGSMAPDGDALAEGRARMARADAVADRVAAVGGVLHGAYGALVSTVAVALSEGSWMGVGIHSAAQWVAWRSGLSMGRARQVVGVAKRFDELPSVMTALGRGELSFDQARLVATHVPARFEASACELARVSTVSQLERVLPRYRWDGDDPPARRATRRLRTIPHPIHRPRRIRLHHRRRSRSSGVGGRSGSTTRHRAGSRRRCPPTRQWCSKQP